MLQNKSNAILKTLAALYTVAFITGCGQSGSSNGGQDSATNSNGQKIALLNALSASQVHGLTIHFDEIDVAEILSYSPLVACPSTGCPAPRQVVHISGVGGISSQGILLAQLNDLDLTVTFDPSLNNGSTCLSVAQSALAAKDQFDIHGQATIIPVEIGSGEGTSSSGTIVFTEGVPAGLVQLSSTAVQIDTQVIPPPIFNTTSVGVVVSEIDLCQQGAPSPAPVGGCGTGGRECAQPAP